eukprot:11988519-Prorocentrum_lima.AAC.1
MGKPLFRNPINTVNCLAILQRPPAAASSAQLTTQSDAWHGNVWGVGCGWRALLGVGWHAA